MQLRTYTFKRLSFATPSMLSTRRIASVVLSSGLRSIGTISSRLIMSGMEKYRDLSRDELIARLAALETAQASSSTPPPSSIAAKDRKQAKQKFNADGTIKEKKEKKFDINKYPCRKIALRFSYDGASYNGLATQSHSAKEDQESIVAVEDVLWKALCATRLVGENQTMGDVGWSRCGRTDAGVSAGGQVVALWVRSRKVDQWKDRKALEEFVENKKREQGKAVDKDEDDVVEGSVGPSPLIADNARIAAEPENEELAYVASLNTVLPSTIRIQAWSPVQPHFSSRFDCRYRHYKYFFTSGCPFIEETMTKGPVPELDISLMKFAAQKLLGDHDFRNFCKVDASKQIENYRRRVDGISIDEVSQSWPRRSSQKAGDVQDVGNSAKTNGKGTVDSETMFVLNLRGTAFLYHQVRHIVAILFLIGARLEKASIIDELLNVEKGAVARDRLLMRRRGLVLNDGEDGKLGEIKTTLPDSTATTMTGLVASDGFAIDTTDSNSNDQLDDLDFTTAESAFQQSVIFDSKPEYEMASDRPLMLWECGFKDKDIQWRSGTYDGNLHSPSPLSGDINSTSTTTAALLHSKWSSLAVTTEMYKHFLLALPLDIDQSQAGYIPSSTFFDQSSLPTLQKATVLVDGVKPVWQQQRLIGSATDTTRKILPLGDGRFKSLQGYKGLFHAKREDTFLEKNAKYLQGRGKRRAEKKGPSSVTLD